MNSIINFDNFSYNLPTQYNIVLFKRNNIRNSNIFLTKQQYMLFWFKTQQT